MTKALFVGSFDPLTTGHCDVLQRAAALFDEVVVAVAHNPQKNAWFSLEQRLHFVAQASKGLPNVHATALTQGMSVALARDIGAHVLVRGVRQTSDLAYEQALAYANRQQVPEVDTVLLLAPPHLMHVSASLVKEVYTVGGDVSQLVPDFVQEALHLRTQ